MNAPRDTTTVAAFYAPGEHSPVGRITAGQASRLSRILARRPSYPITEYGRSKRTSPPLRFPGP